MLNFSCITKNLARFARQGQTAEQTLWRLVVIASLSILTACEDQSRGFNLPEGNVDQGRMTFTLLECSDCHSVRGVAWTGEYTEEKINVPLGGKVTNIKTYGDLVTSIINPSHKLSGGSSAGTTLGNGRSAMRNYNGIMSVQELIDLVEFLQSEYEVWVPDDYKYRH